MDLADLHGARGEWIAMALLAKSIRPDSKLPYFWPERLGEKFESLDLLVKAIDVGHSIPFFFAQVKTTRKPFALSLTQPRLQVRVEATALGRIRAFPVPTYVIGIHEPTERGFIVAASAAQAIRSMTTAHELTAHTLGVLWNEVRGIGHSMPTTMYPSFIMGNRGSS